MHIEINAKEVIILLDTRLQKHLTLISGGN